MHYGLGGLNAYVVYTVTSPKDNSGSVSRRYSHFLWLRNILVRLFPGVFVPPLPPKKVVALETAENTLWIVRERRRDLTRFANRVAANPVLADAKAWEAFLTLTEGWDAARKQIEIDCGGSMLQYKAKSTWNSLASAGNKMRVGHAEVVSRFQQLFPEACRKELDANVEDQIKDLREFVSEEVAKLSEVVGACRSLASSMAHAGKEVGKMEHALTPLVAGESELRRLPSGRVKVPVDAWGKGLADVIPSFTTDLINTFKYELEDLKAFQQLLQHQEIAQQQYAVSTLKAQKWEGKEAVGEKAALQKEKALSNEAEDKILYHIHTNLLWTQWKEMWGTNHGNYRRNLAHFFELQRDNATMMVGQWRNFKESCEV